MKKNVLLLFLWVLPIFLMGAFSQIVLTSQVTGVLPDANGGTGAASGFSSHTGNSSDPHGSTLSQSNIHVGSSTPTTTTPLQTWSTNGDAPGFDSLAYGSFHLSLHATSGAAATATVIAVDMLNDDDTTVAYLEVVGQDSDNTGSEVWKGLMVCYNNSGTLHAVATTTTLTQATVVTEMDDPTVTWTFSGTKASLQIYLSETYSRYACRATLAAYGADAFQH